MDKEDRIVLGACALAAVAFATLTLCAPAGAQTVVGVNTVSKHWSDNTYRYNEVNPGLYVRLDNGLMAGVYRNSVRRTTVFMAQSWSTEYRGWEASVALGLATGYQRRRVWTGESVCADGSLAVNGAQCYVDEGSSRGAVAPFFAPSIASPWVGGWRVRLSGMPPLGSISAVAHIFLETSWKP